MMLAGLIDVIHWLEDVFERLHLRRSCGGAIASVPLVGEGPVVVPGELVQHQTPDFADAAGVLEQIDPCLPSPISFPKATIALHWFLDGRACYNPSIDMGLVERTLQWQKRLYSMKKRL